MALPRSAGEKEDCKMARLPGVSNAPPIPCTMRATMSAVESGASPQTAEETVNQTTPTQKTRRRP